MRIRHLVLIGMNFQNKKSSGDKNFWFDILPLLAGEFKKITILSVRKEQQDIEEFNLRECIVKIIYISPSFLEAPDQDKKIFWREGAFPAWLGVIEKLLTIKRIIRM